MLVKNNKHHSFTHSLIHSFFFLPRLQIVLVPNTDSVKMFQGPSPITDRMKEEYERYRCREQQLGVVRSELPDTCKKYVFMITTDMQKEALGE